MASRARTMPKMLNIDTLPDPEQKEWSRPRCSVCHQLIREYVHRYGRRHVECKERSPKLRTVPHGRSDHDLSPVEIERLMGQSLEAQRAGHRGTSRCWWQR